MAFGTSPPIGLDIGTSAVRAAQVASGKGGLALTAFGQVALPPGAVVDGEIRDPGPVSEAINQLWKRARIKTKDAVIGIANQRVVVRQVDLPYLEEKEFRQSLRFQVADQIPMPVESAELDAHILEDFMTENQEHMMRVLLVAAATDMVEGFVDAASAGGVRPAGLDLTPFAVARAVSAGARGEVGLFGAEAIIDVGAGVTNILVHQGGEPRFVRILLIGGDDISRSLETRFAVPFDEAEAMKLDLGRDVGTSEAQEVLDTQVRLIVDEIRGSIDYYLSQEDSEPISSVILTGGGSLTPGLSERLETTLRSDVLRASPLADIDITKSGLTPEQVAQVEPVAAAAIGLAMGGVPR